MRRLGFASFTLAACLALAFASARANAQTAPTQLSPAPHDLSVSGNALMYTTADGVARALALECSPRIAFVHGDTAYAGCPGGVLLVIRFRANEIAHVERRDQLGGEIQRLFVQDDRVWVEIARLVAGPVDALVPSSEISRADADAVVPVRDHESSNAEADDALSSDGEVIETGLGDVVIDLGARDGIAVGSHVEFTTSHAVSMGPGHAAAMPVRLAVGRVTLVTAGRSRVQLGIDEQVPLGASAGPTTLDLTSSRIAPPRPEGLFDAGLGIAGFFSVSSNALGLLGNVWVGYRFRLPLYLDVACLPYGAVFGIRSGPFGGAVGTDVAVAIARLAISFDTQFFQLGVGVGGATLVGSSSQAPSGGVAFTQNLRLGAVDGLHVMAENAAAVVSGSLNWVGTRVSVRVPLRGGTSLEIRGGGGPAGFGYGTFGVRVLALGNGGHGSVFVTPYAGGAAVFNGFETPAGPALGVELEGRL